MTTFYGISPVLAYQQTFRGATPNPEQTGTQVNEPKYDDSVHELSSTKVGSASTKLARKGIKYVWKKFTTYLAKLFKNDKKTIEDSKKVIDVASDVHRLIEVYQDTGVDNPVPKYNYEA